MTRKQKRAIFFIGTTGVVYFVFRYLLPLVVPFLFAVLLAYGIWKPAKFISKKFHISETISGIFILIFISTIFVGILYIVGGLLIGQIETFVDKLPEYSDSIIQKITTLCMNIEHFFRLKDGCMIGYLYQLLDNMEVAILEEIMPYIMNNSLPFVASIVEITTVSAVVFVATIFCIHERDIILKKKEQSMYLREINVITRRLKSVGGAYLKTELIIMLLTTAICMIGLTVIGNPYGILIGLLLGILDALPIFGTGTVFIPWVIISIINGNWIQAAQIGTIYAICYFLREILEAKLLGERIGMISIETMITMYVGLKLFGLMGLFLGPIGWILIKEIDKTYNMS